MFLIIMVKEMQIQMVLKRIRVGRFFFMEAQISREEVNREKAMIIHLPAGTGSCKLMWVDIKEGFKGLQFAMKARKWRDQKGLSYPFEQENK